MACIASSLGGLPLARLGWVRFRLARARRTWVGKTWCLPAQPLGSHGKQGLEELEVVGWAWGGRRPLAPAATTRARPKGRAPGRTGCLAGALRAGGLPGPGAGRLQRQGRTSRVRRRGRGTVCFLGEADERIGIRAIPVALERIELGRPVGAGRGLVIANAKARPFAPIAWAAGLIGRIARLVQFGSPARLIASNQGRVVLVLVLIQTWVFSLVWLFSQVWICSLTGAFSQTWVFSLF